MTRRNLILDGAVAGLVLGLSLAMLQGGGFGSATPGTRALDALGVALATASALPLAVRRLAPLAVYALISAASLALAVLHYPLDLPFGPLVGVYTLGVAYGGDPRRTRRASALLAANLFVPATAAAYTVSGVPLAEISPELLFWAVIFIAVWITGDRARLRREQLAELEQRAQRAEREAERERRLVAAEERTRIARELHDSAGHAINVILVQAGAARLLHKRDPDRSCRAITIIEQVARSTIGDIDQLVRALREDNDKQLPVPVDPVAFEELLEHHRASGLRIDTDLRGPRHSLPHNVAWAAYRILQEALTNAARHGSGSASVTLSFQAQAVEITVVNPTRPNGSAPSPNGSAPSRNGPKPDRNGHGIIGMRERATLLGGTLVAASRHDSFHLHARLPRAETTS